ncbi:hypothetical protein A1D19_08730 [Lonepinella koalarum]|nr:hypothetical protein [Lonepinella koalarum]MDH2927222.1 hypothetical protein [Lonepinella koalarum]
MMAFTQISSRRIGEITLDITTQETHSSELTITENPIESGAMIADHAVVKPKSITIVGIMVEQDKNSVNSLSFVGNVRGVTDFLNNIPLPFSVLTKTTQTIARAKRFYSTTNAIVNQVANTLNSARSLAPWLPDFGLGSLFSSIGQGRVQQAYADLVACQKSGETIDIQTGIHLYQNMLIESISVTQTLDGSAEFSITAREIFIVQTQTTQAKQGTSGQKPTGNKKSGRSAVQSATKSQKGNTQTTAVKSSVINNGYKKVKGWLG